MDSFGRIFIKLGSLNAVLEPVNKKNPTNGRICLKIELENGIQFIDQNLTVPSVTSTSLDISASNVDNKLEYAFNQQFRTMLVPLNVNSLNSLATGRLMVSLMLSETPPGNVQTSIGIVSFSLVDIFHTSSYNQKYPSTPILISTPNSFFKEATPPSVDLTILFDVDLCEYCFGCSLLSLEAGTSVHKLTSQLCPKLPSEVLQPLLSKLTSIQLQEVASSICLQQNSNSSKSCALQLGFYDESNWTNIYVSSSSLDLAAVVDSAKFSSKYIPPVATPAVASEETKGVKPAAAAKGAKPAETKVEETVDPGAIAESIQSCENLVQWSLKLGKEPPRFILPEISQVIKRSCVSTAQTLTVRLVSTENGEIIAEGPFNIGGFSSRSGITQLESPIIALLGQPDSPSGEARIAASIFPPMFKSDSEIAYAKSKETHSESKSDSVSVTESPKLKSGNNYSLEFVADLIPTERKFGSGKRGRDFSQELRLEIKRIAEEISIEYVSLFPTPERAAELTKEDKEKELYQRLHSDGLYFTFKEQIKSYVQRYVRNLQWTKPSSLQDEDVMLANLYNELLQQATMSMNSLFSETAMRVEDDECLDPSGVDDRRETAEEKVTRLRTLAIDDEANLEWSKGDFRYRNSIAVLEERIKLVSRVTQEMKRRAKQAQYGSMINAQHNGSKATSKERRSLLTIPILEQPFEADETGKMTLLLSKSWMDYALYRLRKLAFHRQSQCAKRNPSLPGDSVDCSIAPSLGDEVITEEFSLAESSLRNCLSVDSTNLTAMFILCCILLENMNVRDAVATMEDLLLSILSKLDVALPEMPNLSDNESKLDWFYGASSFLLERQSEIANKIDCRIHTLACLIFELRDQPILSRIAATAAVNALRVADAQNSSHLMDGLPRRTAVSAFLDLSEFLLSYGMIKHGERCLVLARACEKASSEKAGERNLSNECPHYHRAWMEICESMLMLQTNHYKEALYAAESSISISPNNAKCWKSLCIVQFLNSDDQAICQVLQQCLPLIELSTLQDVAQFTAPLTKADDKQESILFQRLNLFVGRHLHKSCHFDDAMNVYMAMARKSPTCSILREIGYLCLKLNRLEDAENILVQANLLDNNDPKTWGLLATLCLACGEHRQQQAEMSLKQALRLGIAHPAILREMAMKFMEIDRHETAEDLLRRSLAVEPNSLTRRVLADVLNAQNCASEAVEEYRRALIGATSSAEKEKIQSSMIPLLRVLGSDERKSNKEESKR